MSKSEGWGWTNSRRKKPHLHYFVNGKSLCRGTPAAGFFNHPGRAAISQRCPTCKARLKNPLPEVPL